MQNNIYKIILTFTLTSILTCHGEDQELIRYIDTNIECTYEDTRGELCRGKIIKTCKFKDGLAKKLTDKANECPPEFSKENLIKRLARKAKSGFNNGSQWCSEPPRNRTCEEEFLNKETQVAECKYIAQTQIHDGTKFKIRAALLSGIYKYGRACSSVLGELSTED